MSFPDKGRGGRTWGGWGIECGSVGGGGCGKRGQLWRGRARRGEEERRGMTGRMRNRGGDGVGVDVMFEWVSEGRGLVVF